MHLNRLTTLALAGTLAAGVITVAPSAADEPIWDLESGTISSNPAQHYGGGADAFAERFPEAGAIEIDYTLYKPADLAPGEHVPMILHSHGWGSSKTNNAGSFAAYAEAGYGVLSFTQRGFGATGGKAHLENIDVEGRDVQRVIDFVADLDWVQKEAGDETDPVLGAIGGSYGGGYQLAGAFADHRDGLDRLDAIAPEITWNSLAGSLAPNDTVRTTWVTALYAAGANAHTQLVHEAFAYGAATGEWPTGQGIAPGVSVRDLDAFMHDASPATHVAKHGALDIPVLIGQGTTDNLFNLNQGLANFESITDATDRSIFIGYNGGHVLPEAFPMSSGPSGDPCSAAVGGGSFGALALQFFDVNLKGTTPSPAFAEALGGFHIAASSENCISTDSIATTQTIEVPVGVAVSGVGAPTQVELLTNDTGTPIRIAGIADVAARATTAGLDNRLFAALAIGTTAADAQVVQGNVLPIRWAGKHLAGAETTTSIAGDLPGIGAIVEPGQTLFLTLSPNATMYFGHGARTPSPVVLTDIVVNVPVVD